MNVAIVIGISEYDNIDNLPSCKNDAKIINNILDHNKKYDEILLLDNKTSSQNIKRSIIDFIQKYRTKEIEEFFIYFSGHGYYDGNEFYYICTNYNKEKIKQSSFENKELDSYIKLLNPKLTVKIIDSCQSGVQYIKDINGFQEYIQKDQNNFNNCYFLYSSQNHQSSYANKNISFFTKELIESLINIDVDNIRYKDIIDYISDSFLDNSEQRPFFVIQADLTEEFIVIDKSFKETLQKHLITKTIVENNNEEKKSLLDVVKNDSKRYFEKKDIINILEKVKILIEKFNFDEVDFKNLYETTINFNNDYSSIPKIRNIAKWSDKNTKDFFIETIYQEEIAYRRVPKNDNGIGNIGSIFSGKMEYKKEKVYVNNPVKVKSSTDLDYNYIFIKNSPKFQNLSSTCIYIIPFISKTKILFFTAFSTFKNIGWDEEKINLDLIEWIETQINLSDTDKINDFINKSISEFMIFTLEEVKKTVNFSNEKDINIEVIKDEQIKLIQA